MLFPIFSKIFRNQILKNKKHLISLIYVSKQGHNLDFHLIFNENKKLLETSTVWFDS